MGNEAQEDEAMTAQTGETLHYRGETIEMFAEPLASFFMLGGFRPRFSWPSTALSRGYVGTWEITDGRLYLIGLKGSLEDGTPASLATIFPDYPERAFAHWYSGTIRVPRGRLLEYVHADYESVYEADLLLDFERGVLTATRVQRNRIPADDAGYADPGGPAESSAARNADEGGVA